MEELDSTHRDIDIEDNMFSQKTEHKKKSAPKQTKHFTDQQLRALGWSDARIKAWNNKDKNPNAYYYRFNDPGIPQATGPWTDVFKN